MTDNTIADLTAKLATTQKRIIRDREHARQIDDPKVRDEVETYVKELERSAEKLAAQIAALKESNPPVEPEQDIAALKPPATPDTDS